MKRKTEDKRLYIIHLSVSMSFLQQGEDSWNLSFNCQTVCVSVCTTFVCPALLCVPAFSGKSAPNKGFPGRNWTCYWGGAWGTMSLRRFKLLTIWRNKSKTNLRVSNCFRCCKTIWAQCGKTLLKAALICGWLYGRELSKKKGLAVNISMIFGLV